MLAVLGITAAAQAVVFVASGSVALLADLIHNAGDAATAIPLAIAFALRSARAGRSAGLAVVAANFISAGVAGYEAVYRLLQPREVDPSPVQNAGDSGCSGPIREMSGTASPSPTLGRGTVSGGATSTCPAAFNDDLCVMDTDGSDVVNLTNTPATSETGRVGVPPLPTTTGTRPYGPSS